jgi:hypothetical protein
MPVRSFRLFIKNTSEDVRLHKRNEHLCWGSWTSHEWMPPMDILPGEEKGFQSESTSGSFATGTEGWAKYEVVDSSNQGLGMVFAYWDNPYALGNTYFGCDKAFDDVTAPCDDSPDSSGDTSDFSSARPGKPDNFDLFRISMGQTESAMTSPFTAGILPNCEAHAEFVFRPSVSGSFGSLGQKSVAPIVDAVGSNWTGDWTGGSITIKIRQTLWNVLQVSVVDETANPALTFSETFSIGENSRIVQTAIDSVSTLTGDTSNATLARAVKMTVSDALRKVPATQPQSAISPRIIGALLTAADDLSISLTTKGISKIARQIAAAHSKSRYQAWLSHGVALELDWILQGGIKVGEQIHYMRVLRSGVVAADAILQVVPSIH